MQCPKCSKEINDSSVFCGYCGEPIKKPSDDTATKKAPAPKKAKEKKPKEKKVKDKTSSKSLATYFKSIKNIKMKIFVLAISLSVLTGSVLGFLSARGFINIESLFKEDQIHWADPPETVAPESSSSDSDKKEPADTSAEDTSAEDTSSEDTSSEDTSSDETSS